MGKLLRRRGRLVAGGATGTGRFEAGLLSAKAPARWLGLHRQAEATRRLNDRTAGRPLPALPSA